VSKEMGKLQARIAEDDDTLELKAEEREELNRELKVLEQEYGYWCKVYSGRLQEKKVQLALWFGWQGSCCAVVT
jgi:hypothetical protein